MLLFYSESTALAFHRRSTCIKQNLIDLGRSMIQPDITRQASKPADFLRILVADDNVIEQKITARMFSIMGYHADVVSNGFEVVQAVRLRPYDVVLLDEHMPALNAMETASRIRTLPALWKQPWIILLGDNHRAQKDYKKTGIDDAVTKPLNEEKIWQALARVQHVGKVV